ncbi:MAG: response regulator transcription factor [Anaerolineae bacterium]|nr:response regulator transcription factor [Anaerolineae bacterium]
MPTILVVDDNPKMLNMLRRTLIYAGYDVLTADSGQQALTLAQSQRPDAIVLDWLMPGIDGLEVARRVSKADSIPMIMLTARDALEDKVTGLDSGADDYLVKPFEPDELLARIRALLRRTTPTDGESVLTYDSLSLDPVTRDVRRDERLITLSPKEFDLLSYFMRHPRRVLTRERLLEEVWGYDFGGDANVLEVYVGHLRTKLEANDEPRLIQTVRGVGYVLRQTEEIES